MGMRPALAVWGAGLGLAVTLFFSPVPVFQRDVLKKIPAVSLPCRPLAVRFG